VRTLAVAALAVAACAAAAAPAGAAPRLVQIAAAAQPTHVAAAPGDPTALYVVEKAGRILVYRNGAPQPFLQLSGLFADGEGGLLSVAFAADYATSGLLYTYSSTADLNVEIDEFRRSASDPGRADPATRRVVLRIPHPGQTNHWGGQLQFGPDGFLYAGTGDGGGANDPAENAENLGSLLGKLLRIDPRGATPYAIPAGNPFVAAAGARPEIWAYGLRNPWRFSFDRATGDLAIADVGQGAWEEVDFAPRGTGAGAFYGWDAFEGLARVASEPLPAAAHTPPVLVRPHTEGDCSITGGYVVRAPDLPSLAGRYLHADFCVGALRSALLQPGSAVGDAPVGLNVGSPSSFGQDLGGCLYVVSLDGGVFRLTESPAPVVPCVEPSPPPPPLPPPPPPPPAPPAPAPTSTAAPSPAVRDTTPPDTTIERGPAARTTNRRVTIQAVASEPSRFECSLDDAAFAACALPFTTPRLAEGAHGLQLRAVDAAGNVETEPASWTWRVDFDPLRRWDLEVLLGRLSRAVRTGTRIRAGLEPHVTGRVSVQLRTVQGRLLAADRGLATSALRVDLGRTRSLRPLVLTGRFGAVTLTRRIARSP
jgi:glucose/arabinose dehydrogenase